MTVTEAARAGRLKVFLGYAAGVGKTYQMLSEAQRAEARAASTSSSATSSRTGERRRSRSARDSKSCRGSVVEYRGASFEEMDTDAVLRRHPAVAVVDEFPHTNVPGSPRAKRWEDVHVLLDAGIDVLTTMNVQHLESLNDQIWQSTGVRVRETIPDWVLKQADEVVMVDLTPRALLNRLAARRRVPAGSGAGGAAELLQGVDARRASRAGDAAGRATPSRAGSIWRRSLPPARVGTPTCHAR